MTAFLVCTVLYVYELKPLFRLKKGKMGKKRKMGEILRAEDIKLFDASFCRVAASFLFIFYLFF